MLNGGYVVYYDKNKTKLMAKISFSNDKVNGKLERYGLDGNKVYETTINMGKIDGLLKVFKDLNLFIQMLFEMDKVKLVILNGGYSYTVNYDVNELPSGEIDIAKGSLKVITGTLSSGVFDAMTIYRANGTIDSNLQYTDGKYDLTNRYRLDQTKDIVFEYENGMRGVTGNILGSMYFNLNTVLKYGHDILQQFGKDYRKI